MSRYYFHDRRGQVTFHDEGMELADLREAAIEAVRRGREITRGEALLKGAQQPRSIVIDDQWRTILEIAARGIGGIPDA
jgi:hypothetical protein